MKNYLLLNYNIKIDKVYTKDNKKYFFYNSNKYYIVENIKDIKKINELVRITNYLYNKRVFVNTFVINNERTFYSKKDESYICILKVNNNEYEYSLDYIFKFQGINNNLDVYDILSEWKNEVDSLEKEMIEYNSEFQLVQDSINYFIGEAENAIQLLGMFKNFKNDSIGHLTNYKMSNDCILDNPFTFIKTNKMFDISNYIKYKFINNKIDFNEIEYICNNINDENDKVFLFSCLLYPNIYFDLVKNILNNKEKEEKINIIIKRIKEYKEILCYIQNIFKNVNMIKLITWLSE